LIFLENEELFINKGKIMAYKYKNGKVVKISLPNKISKKMKKELELYYQNTDETRIYKHFAWIKKLKIDVRDSKI
jgi:hypothetical protein